MDRRPDDTIDVERLLDEVGKLMSALPESSGAEFSEVSQEPSIPAFHEIEIDDRNMEVRANLYPPVGGGDPLKIEAIYESLSKAGVVYGVLHPQIRSSVLDLNTERRAREGVVLARGSPPIDVVPEHWELLPELLHRRTRLDEQALSLDPKSLSPFVMVTQGEVLAVRIGAVAGSSGRDVFGKELPFRISSRGFPTPGARVVEDGAACKAATDGCFRWDDHVFKVDDVLVVDGVDYGTGHIDFSGDVVIQGEIARGFRIKAGGSVFSSQVIDAFEVVAGGDVVSTKGIIGREGSTVQAEGRVRAKFLENVSIRAVGSIEVKASTLNSVLRTLDKVVMGEKSLLMGGRVVAQNGIEAFQIGTERGAFAELCCGMDYVALEKVVGARDQSIELVKKLKEIERQKRLHPSMKGVLDKAYDQVREEVTRLSNFSRHWVGQIDRREEARVEVRGTIYPGNSVEICHVSMVVSKPMSRVRFFLDKTRGTIAWEPL